jgi:flagellar basal body-associated protein FliL
MKKIIPIIAVIIVAAMALTGCSIFGGSKGELPYVRTEHATGDYFVVNVKDSGRLLKATVFLVLNTNTLEATLTERDMEIRDTIIATLRTYDETALRALDLSPIKAKLVSTLNEKLEIDNITDILFIDYALQ